MGWCISLTISVGLFVICLFKGEKPTVAMGEGIGVRAGPAGPAGRDRGFLGGGENFGGM